MIGRYAAQRALELIASDREAGSREEEEDVTENEDNVETNSEPGPEGMAQATTGGVV